MLRFMFAKGFVGALVIFGGHCVPETLVVEHIASGKEGVVFNVVDRGPSPPTRKTGKVVKFLASLKSRVTSAARGSSPPTKDTGKVVKILASRRSPKWTQNQTVPGRHTLTVDSFTIDNGEACLRASAINNEVKLWCEVLKTITEATVGDIFTAKVPQIEKYGTVGTVLSSSLAEFQGLHFFEMENAGKDLFSILSYDPAKLKSMIVPYFPPLLELVKNMHSHKIAHRDLKAENVAISGNTVYMLDFGFAEKYDDDLVGYVSQNMTGTDLNFPHSILVEGEKSYSYTYVTDAESIGYILLEMHIDGIRLTLYLMRIAVETVNTQTIKNTGLFDDLIGILRGDMDEDMDEITKTDGFEELTRTSDKFFASYRGKDKTKLNRLKLKFFADTYRILYERPRFARQLQLKNLTALEVFNIGYNAKQWLEKILKVKMANHCTSSNRFLNDNKQDCGKRAWKTILIITSCVVGFAIVAVFAFQARKRITAKATKTKSIVPQTPEEAELELMLNRHIKELNKEPVPADCVPIAGSDKEVVTDEPVAAKDASADNSSDSSDESEAPESPRRT